MKILFTGMGSHHCAKPLNVSFFSVLDKVLSEEAEVVWESPQIYWTKEYLNSYDQIIFGFLPPTSLSANKIFGAMNVISLMFDSPKLRVIVDSPQIWQYKNSIAAFLRDPNILFGNFYSKKENYQAALKNKKLIEKASAHLMVSEWPTIFYPGLPWNSDEKIASNLGFGSKEKVVGLSVDALLIDPEVPRIGRKDVWAVENSKNSWFQSAQKGLAFPHESTKERRKTDDSYAMSLIQNSVGLILPPQERNLITWWNYRLIQALNTYTPVVTRWEETKNFNQTWSMLGYQIEDMTSSQRQVLASTQRNVYLEALPSADEATQTIKNYLLDYSKERI